MAISRWGSSIQGGARWRSARVWAAWPATDGYGVTTTRNVTVAEKPDDECYVTIRDGLARAAPATWPPDMAIALKTRCIFMRAEMPQ